MADMETRVESLVPASGLYSGPIVDSHMHLWDLSMHRHSWLSESADFAGGRYSWLAHDYLLSDYRRDIEGEGVVASVHIEALWDRTDDPRNETGWLESLDHTDDLASRYVVAVQFGCGDTEDQISHAAEADRVAGVRQIIAWHPSSRSMTDTEHLVKDPDWRSALPALQAADLILELLLFPGQAVEVAELAAEFPDLTIVVYHLASPFDTSSEGLALWSEGLQALARVGNVMLKISSVQDYLPVATMEATTGIIRKAVDEFGANRVMIGSDFPVGGKNMSLHAVLLQYRTAMSHLSPAQQFAVFCGNAARVYNMPQYGIASTISWGEARE